MDKPLRRRALAVVATTAALALATASPAWAHPTWTVTVVGSSTSNTPIAGTNAGNITLTFTDPWTGTTTSSISCSASSSGGTIKVGSGLTNPLASISTLSFGGAPAPHADKCLGPDGIREKIIPNPSSLPLPLHSIFHLTPTADEATGELRGFWVTLAGTDGCVATIGGPGTSGTGGVTPTKTTNSTDRLALTAGGNLRVLTANQYCDPAYFDVSYTVSITGTYTLNKNVTITD